MQFYLSNSTYSNDVDENDEDVQTVPNTSANVTLDVIVNERNELELRTIPEATSATTFTEGLPRQNDAVASSSHAYSTFRSHENKKV